MNLYNFTVKDAKHEDISLSKYKGKVVLIVNTATKCGLTPQYKELETLYEKYKDQGLEVLDFPCNQFLKQAPGTDEEITEFCTLNYGTTFTRFAKLDVNGKDADPLFVYLKEQAPTETEDSEAVAFKKKVKLLHPFSKAEDIQWNFTKFLVDKEGSVVTRFSPTYKPEDLAAFIEKLL